MSKIAKKVKVLNKPSAKPAAKEKKSEAPTPALSSFTKTNGDTVPMIVLNPESPWSKLQFGVAKAKMIIECLPYIQAFVKTNGQSVDPKDA